MSEFYMVRVGKDSPDIAKAIDGAEGARDKIQAEVVCTQVPRGLSEGDYIFFVLGSDNDKGIAPPWKRGVRAIGRVLKRSQAEKYNDSVTINVETILVFPFSLSKLEMLNCSPSAYNWMADMPMLGIDSFSNQTVQAIRAEDDRQDVRALLYILKKGGAFSEKDFRSEMPDVSELLEYIPPSPSFDNDDRKGSLVGLEKDDPVRTVVEDLLDRGYRSFLFMGPPGTGKTHAAHNLAVSLVENPSEQIDFVQFHPSYSYDDFVEGYVPDSGVGEASGNYFVLRPKIFRLACEKAQDNRDKLFVLVIDEINRGDPSRIFGELLTFLEEGYREVGFKLAYSGMEFSVPSNLAIIATMNPYDHSISDLDAALDRRFYKMAFDPDPNALKRHYESSSLDQKATEILVQLFSDLQDFAPFGGLGQTYFLKVLTSEDLKILWDHQLRFLFQRALMDDQVTFEQVREMFGKAQEELKRIEILDDEVSEGA